MKEMLKDKTKIIHIAIIILGSIFIMLGCFHTAMWFDESYSVAITNHSFSEIWSIGGHDVHPILYYWLLKIIFIFIGGKNVLVYRLFSAFALIILGILGYTHIRKDFGEKTGILFSFFSFFLPVNLVYAGEIRMYTWGMLFVTLMGIYAYRIKKQEGSIKNWIIFAIFSLASSYIHYYGLITAGITNLFMFIYFLLKSIQQRNIISNLKKFFIFALIQVILYMPWLVILLQQIGGVTSGFWIKFKFPDSIIEMFTFQFTGNLDNASYIGNPYAIIFSVFIFLYVVYLILKKKQQEKNPNLKPAFYAIMIYFAVILAVSIISIIIKQPIIYARYFLIITGLLMFFLAQVMSQKGSTCVNIVICIIVLITSTIVNINIIQTNYDKSNNEPIEYMKNNLQSSDIFIYGNGKGDFGSGFVIAANYPEYTQYFYDKENWDVEEAYKAYAKTIYNLDILKDYHGRIWFMGNEDFYKEAEEQFDDIELIEQKQFNTKYKNYEYSFILANKK